MSEALLDTHSHRLAGLELSHYEMEEVYIELRGIVWIGPKCR